jgi:hypothetical protein
MLAVAKAMLKLKLGVREFARACSETWQAARPPWIQLSSEHCLRQQSVQRLKLNTPNRDVAQGAEIFAALIGPETYL